MASEIEEAIRDLESLACSCEYGWVCGAHKVVERLRNAIADELNTVHPNGIK